MNLISIQSNHEFQQLTTVADKSEFAKLKEVVDDGLGRVRSSVRYLQNLISTPATSEMYISALATQMDTCETEIESLKVQQNQVSVPVPASPSSCWAESARPSLPLGASCTNFSRLLLSPGL